MAGYILAVAVTSGLMIWYSSPPHRIIIVWNPYQHHHSSLQLEDVKLQSNFKIQGMKVKYIFLTFKSSRDLPYDDNP
jgi:hypothetical protein